MIIMFFSTVCRADIFVPGTSEDHPLRQTIAADRAGRYYAAPGVAWSPHETSVSAKKEDKIDALTRAAGLDDVDASFQKAFDDAFQNDRSVDNYSSQQNKLLLLSYSSPALADTIKHYRSIAMQRLLLEYDRLGRLEQAAAGPLEDLRMASDLKCLQAQSGLGLVQAMRECHKEHDFFKTLPLFTGDGSWSGKNNIHVVAAAVGMLGLPEANAGTRVAALSGDVVVGHSQFTVEFPTETFSSMAEHDQGIWERRWDGILKKQASRDDPTEKELAAVSLPGAPVMPIAVAALALLTPEERSEHVLRLSSYGARDAAEQECRRSLVLLKHASTLPKLTPVFREIILSRKDALEKSLEAEPDRVNGAPGYKVLLFDLMQAADHRRAELAGLLKD